VDFDDHVLALSQDANLPIHFVQGIKAVTTAGGQTAAALADVLVKGISQERVRRLLRRLHGTTAIADLPPDWPRVLPTDAPLATFERWEQAFAQATPSDWPDGVDRSGLVLDILRILEKGGQFCTPNNSHQTGNGNFADSSEAASRQFARSGLRCTGRSRGADRLRAAAARNRPRPLGASWPRQVELFEHGR
jgi:hypothetical protein